VENDKLKPPKVKKKKGKAALGQRGKAAGRLVGYAVAWLGRGRRRGPAGGAAASSISLSLLRLLSSEVLSLSKALSSLVCMLVV
jgi:hypothetical protein